MILDIVVFDSSIMASTIFSVKKHLHALDNIVQKVLFVLV